MLEEVKAACREWPGRYEEFETSLLLVEEYKQGQASSTAHKGLMVKWCQAMLKLLVMEAKGGPQITGQPPSLLLLTVLTVEYPSFHQCH